MGLDLEFANGGRRFVFRTDPILAAPSPESLFAPDSVIRRVFSDTALLGGGRAILLQIANPQVAAGVYEHSDFTNKPIDRALGTAYAMTNVVYGSRNQIEHMRHALAGVHARVQGPGYRALDPANLLWVNATLADTAVLMYEKIIGPLTRAELDEFYSDARYVAEVFGCPLDAQPATAADFRDYWNAELDRMHVTPEAYEIGRSLMNGIGLPMRPLWMPSVRLARSVAAATLPPRLRDGFGLAWGPAQAIAAETLFRTTGAVLPHLPLSMRQVGAYLGRVPDDADRPGRSRTRRRRNLRTSHAA